MSRHGTARGARKTLPVVERNEAFEEFYRKQSVAQDWDDFMETLRRPMPVVVRINRTKPHWQALQESFARDMRWSELAWFPGAWQCDAESYDDALRSQCSALNKAYALRFQEAASLVPPLLLEVKSKDLLLDLCAAPGSKTLECLEIMQEAGDQAGVVIANDADAERCLELLPLITRKETWRGDEGSPSPEKGCTCVVIGNRVEPACEAFVRQLSYNSTGHKVDAYDVSCLREKVALPMCEKVSELLTKKNLTHLHEMLNDELAFNYEVSQRRLSYQDSDVSFTL